MPYGKNDILFWDKLLFWLPYILGVLILFLVASLSLSPSEELQGLITRFAYGEEIVHALCYAYLMVQSSLTFPGRFSGKIIFVVLLAMGLGIEVIQELIPNRGFEIGDVAANVSGLLMGWGICQMLPAAEIQRRCD